MPWFLRVSGKGEWYRDEQDEGEHGHRDVERKQCHQHPPEEHYYGQSSFVVKIKWPVLLKRSGL